MGFNSFGVTGLTEFHLPKNVETFNGAVVNQSPLLNILTVAEENNNFASYKNFIFDKEFTKLIRAPINAQIGDIPLIKQIQQINYFAFSGSQIKKFIAAANLTNLENNSFHACLQLEFVDLSLSSMKTIISETFRGDKKIETLILPRNLEKLEEKSLEKMKKLKELIIPETVKSISVNTIVELSQLKEIYVLCPYSSGFEDKRIFNSYSDNVAQTKVQVHVLNAYFESNDKFGGFTVTNDLYKALYERMKRKLACTKLTSYSHPLQSSIFFLIFISR